MRGSLANSLRLKEKAVMRRGGLCYIAWYLRNTTVHLEVIGIGQLGSNGYYKRGGYSSTG